MARPSPLSAAPPGSAPGHESSGGSRLRRAALCAAATAVLLFGPTAAGSASAQALPDTILVREPGLHPEGIAWDAPRDRFLISSVTMGRVTSVRDDGSHDVLVEDPELQAAIGIHIDRRDGRLLVANADLSAVQGDARGLAKLGIYDLETGERLLMVDLGALRPDGRHFANDVTVDPEGTAYVTDSFTPVIYRVTPAGDVSVLVEDPLLGAEGFGLNGIDHHPDGYLLVAVAGRRTLVRVPLDAPGELQEVELSEPLAADGLVLQEDGDLVAVATTGQGESARNETLVLRSDDGWSSARVVGRAPAPGATTAAMRDDAVYVVDPRFGDMGGEGQVPVFEIYRVRPGE